MYDTLCFLLLTCPAPTDVSAMVPTDCVEFRTAMIRQLKSHEIYLSWDSGNPDKLDQYRQRLEDSHDWPRVSDASRFVWSNNYDVTLSYRVVSGLRERLARGYRDEEEKIFARIKYIEEVRDLYYLAKATQTTASPYYVREYLHKLKSTLSDEEYESGNLPELLPTWIFIPLP